MTSTLSTIFNFRLNSPLTLRFKDLKQEAEYQAANHSDGDTQLRLAILLVGFYYCCFAVTDFFALRPELPIWVFQLHLFQGFIFILLIGVSFQVSSSKWLQTIFVYAYSQTWVTHVTILLMAQTQVYLAEIYFFILWTWVASGFSITKSFKLCLTFILLYEVILLMYSNEPASSMVTHQIFIATSLTLGGLSGYLSEYYKRQAYTHHREVLIEKQKVEEAILVKNKFFSIISHDLRGPIGGLATLFDQFHTDEGVISGDLLLTIRDRTKLTFELLENLLLWARSQQDTLESHPVPFDFSTPVDHTLQLMSGFAEQKGIKLVSHVESGSICRADQSMVTTVVRNLLLNAIKYTFKGGTITLEAKMLEAFWKISVSDTGKGLSPDVQAHLFDLSVSTGSTGGTLGEKGSGLGLILCKEFVEKNGGLIGVESQVGQGSRFWFTLPLESDSDGEKPAPERLS